MVSVQARLVALLALCLFASTVGSLPSNKPRGELPLDKSILDPNTVQKGGGFPLGAKEEPPKANEGKAPADNRAQTPPQNASSRARRAPQNDHVLLGKRDYPGHTRRSNSRRNRPNNRYPKHHRHGHAKAYNRKPVSHSPRERNKYSDGFSSTRF